MDRRALTRLRIAFLLLGAALLLPLGFLMRSVEARLEAQRRLRHELVAERIFDEMERELTGLLQRENARPSAAYDDSGTRVENWAPFVVGYFTRDVHRAQIIAKSQLAPERVQRLEEALSIGKGALRPAAASAGESAPSEARKRSVRGATGAAAPVLSVDEAAPAAAAFKGENDKLVPAAAPAPMDARRLGTSDVLKQLNRANEAREHALPRAAAPAEPKAKSSARKAASPADEKDDPLSGY